MKATLEWTTLIESWIKSLAIIAAGWWTWRHFVRRRQKYPRAITSHFIKIYELDSNTKLVHLEVVVENKGEVLVEILNGHAFIQQIVPLPRSLKSLDENRELEFEWPHLDKIVELQQERDRTEIEPSESDSIHFEFVMDNDITLFKADSHLENRTKKVNWSWKKLKWEQHKIGWNCTSVHSSYNTEKEKETKMAKHRPPPPPPLPPEQLLEGIIQGPPKRDPPPVKPTKP